MKLKDITAIDREREKKRKASRELRKKELDSIKDAIRKLAPKTFTVNFKDLLKYHPDDDISATRPFLADDFDNYQMARAYRMSVSKNGSLGINFCGMSFSFDHYTNEYHIDDDAVDDLFALVSQLLAGLEDGTLSFREEEEGIITVADEKAYLA